MNRSIGSRLTLVLALAGLGIAAEGNAQVTRVEQDHPSVTYTGNWQTLAHPGFSGGTQAVAQDEGASVTVTFTGTGIAWIGSQCPCGGTASILIDGQPRNIEHAWSTTRRDQQDLYWINHLEPGPHVMTITVNGFRSSGTGATGGTYIGIDAFDSGSPLYSTLPTISLTSPADNSLVTGLVTINAEVADNAGISQVVFNASDATTGITTPIGVDDTPPYSLTRDTSDIPHASSYRLWAVAWDHVGNQQRSNEMLVTIAHGGHTDFTRPFIEMTAPANGATVTGFVTISADGYDNLGIARVEFRVFDANTATTRILTDTTAPYAFTADTSGIPSGMKFSIGVTAYDAAGNSYTATNGSHVTVQH